LKYDMLPKILKQKSVSDFYYPPDQYGFIISLMKKFELSYELDEWTVLLPSLLEIQEPYFVFDFVGTLRLIIDYDFLPSSVITRFIVKMNKDIKNGLLWRTGVVLENHYFNSVAVIKADNEEKKIYILVNGEQKRDYLAVILQKIREINSSFEKLVAMEKIPLPDDSNMNVSYKYLINLEEKGFERFLPVGSQREYNVSELLGTVCVPLKTQKNAVSLLNKKYDISTTDNQKIEDRLLRILKKMIREMNYVGELIVKKDDN